MNQDRVTKLLEAVYRVFNHACPNPTNPKPKWAPKPDGTTFCNLAVNSICFSFGYVGFARPTKEDPDGVVTANIMHDMMSDPKNGWIKVKIVAAQNYANTGALVVSAQKEAGHGHVAVVMPGEMKSSGSWGTLAPIIMNIGKDVFLGLKASWAFQSPPDYFVLSSTTGETIPEYAKEASNVI
jgi:hypothetical protein